MTSRTVVLTYIVPISGALAMASVDRIASAADASATPQCAEVAVPAPRLTPKPSVKPLTERSSYPIYFVCPQVAIQRSACEQNDSGVDSQSTGTCRQGISGNEESKDDRGSNAKEGDKLPSSPPKTIKPKLIQAGLPTAPETTTEGDGLAAQLTRSGLEFAAFLLLLVLATLLVRLGLGLLSGTKLEDASEVFVFRRHWGGFGGENSGWNLSAPLGRCLAGLVMTVLGAVLAVESLLLLHGSNNGNPQTSAQQQTVLNSANTGPGASVSDANAGSKVDHDFDRDASPDSSPGR